MHQEDGKSEEMLKLIKSWFLAIFSSVKQLIEFCQEPFPGVKRTAIPIFVSETVQCRNAGLQVNFPTSQATLNTELFYILVAS